MQVTCPRCRGRGFVGQPCNQCHGSGTREDSFEPFKKSQLLDLRPSFLLARSSRLDSAEGETHSDAIQNALREWQLANVF